MPLSYVSFKISVPMSVENTIVADGFWPEGVSISPFFDKRPNVFNRFLRNSQPVDPTPPTEFRSQVVQFRQKSLSVTSRTNAPFRLQQAFTYIPVQQTISPMTYQHRAFTTVQRVTNPQYSRQLLTPRSRLQHSRQSSFSFISFRLFPLHCFCFCFL